MEELLLAPDPAQHAQTGGGVGAECGQLADLLALVALARLQRLDDQAEQEDEDGHAEQHEQAEQNRRREQDERDDDAGDDGAREPRGDVEGTTRPHSVVRDRGDDLTRRKARTHGGARASRVVGDDLCQPERRLEPVEDGEAVAHDATEGLHEPEAKQCQRPERERMVVVSHDPALDRATDGEGHQGLRDHPHDAEEDAAEQGRALVPRDPDRAGAQASACRAPLGGRAGSWTAKRFPMRSCGPQARLSIVAAAAAGRSSPEHGRGRAREQEQRECGFVSSISGPGAPGLAIGAAAARLRSVPPSRG